MFAAAPNFARTAVAALGTVLFAGACLMGATAPAAAATATPMGRSTQVAYGDLNLASAKGRDTLDGRIAQAARNVCHTGSRELAVQAAYRDCVRTAVGDARRKAYVTTASSN